MNQSRLLDVLVAPHMSEKAYRVGDTNNQVTFKVLPDASKLEIKRAVEKLFEVQVAEVKTVNVKGKVRRFGRIEGKTKAWKKAYVRLKPGHDIQFGSAE